MNRNLTHARYIIAFGIYNGYHSLSLNTFLQTQETNKPKIDSKFESGHMYEVQKRRINNKLSLYKSHQTRTAHIIRENHPSKEKKKKNLLLK